MDRRKFLQLLGLAPAALVAAKLLPQTTSIPAPKDSHYLVHRDHATQEVLVSDWHFGDVVKWQPSTVYKVGDRLVIDGHIRKVITAGISGDTEPLWSTSLPSGTVWFKKEKS